MNSASGPLRRPAYGVIGRWNEGESERVHRSTRGEGERYEYKESWNSSFPPKQFSPAWVPVMVNGNSYEYRFKYYQCDMAGSRAEKAPRYCPFDVVVKGEVVSMDPPQVRETETVSASWSSSPSPAGCPVGTSEYVWEIVPK